MNPMLQTDFDAAVEGKNLTPAIRNAVEDHIVRGLPILEACAKHRVSTAGFYRAANTIKQFGEPEGYRPMTRIVVMVPDEHAAEMRQKIAWQLAQWAKVGAK